MDTFTKKLLTLLALLPNIWGRALAVVVSIQITTYASVLTWLVCTVVHIYVRASKYNTKIPI